MAYSLPHRLSPHKNINLFPIGQLKRFRINPGLTKNGDKVMVHILDRHSGVYVRSNICYWICFRHLNRSRAVTESDFFQIRKNNFPYACATLSELPSCTMVKSRDGRIWLVGLNICHEMLNVKKASKKVQIFFLHLFFIISGLNIWPDGYFAQVTKFDIRPDTKLIIIYKQKSYPS